MELSAKPPKSKKDVFTLFFFTIILTVVCSVLYGPILKMLTAGQVQSQVSFCINHAPEFNNSCPSLATVGTLYTCDVDANDSDFNGILFFDNSTFFNISNLTGLINFTPTAIQNGTHAFLITAQDDSACVRDSSFTLSLTISFPGAGGGGEVGGGGGGGGGGRAVCVEQWNCTEWSKCKIYQYRERTCSQVRTCLNKKSKEPDETERCSYPFLPPKKKVAAPTPAKMLYIGSFDVNDSYQTLFSLLEPWVFTWKGANHTVTVLALNNDNIDVGISSLYSFFSVTQGRLELVDADGDDIPDFEFTLHNITAEGAIMTMSLHRPEKPPATAQQTIVIEKPQTVIPTSQTKPTAGLLLLVLLIMLGWIILLLLLRGQKKSK